MQSDWIGVPLVLASFAYCRSAPENAPLLYREVRQNDVSFDLTANGLVKIKKTFIL